MRCSRAARCCKPVTPRRPRTMPSCTSSTRAASPARPRPSRASRCRRSLRADTQQVFVSGCATNLRAGAVRRDRSARATVRGDGRGRRGRDGRRPRRVRRPRPRRARPRHAQQAARTRGFVKVQDGCDCHCAYCIIPTVRGSARSRPASAVLGEVRRRVAQGQPEMVMTGISVGDYRDPEHGLELGELMVEVAQVPGVERVRLSSVEVIHVKDSLLEALATEPKVCPHLHVPMQSGDDLVLRDMGRHYTAEEYVGQIKRAPGVGAPRERDDRRDRRLSDRGRRRVRAHAAGDRRRGDHPRARVLVLAAAGDRRGGARRPRVARRTRSAARASCAATPRSALATIAPPSSAAASAC